MQRARQTWENEVLKRNEELLEAARKEAVTANEKLEQVTHGTN
jgi:hypothetical protein